jgi:hypothetical protein
MLHAMGLEQAHHGLGAIQFIASISHYRRYLHFHGARPVNTRMYTILAFPAKSVNGIRHKPSFIGVADFAFIQ